MAYGHMKTRRPLVRPNDGFWRQLVNYERELKRRKKVSCCLLMPMLFLFSIWLSKILNTSSKMSQSCRTIKLINTWWELKFINLHNLLSLTAIIVCHIHISHWYQTYYIERVCSVVHCWLSFDIHGVWLSSSLISTPNNTFFGFEVTTFADIYRHPVRELIINIQVIDTWPDYSNLVMFVGV